VQYETHHEDYSVFRYSFGYVVNTFSFYRWR